MHVRWTGLGDEWAMGGDDTVRERQKDTDIENSVTHEGSGAVSGVRCSSLLGGSVSRICRGNCSLLLIVFYSFVD